MEVNTLKVSTLKVEPYKEFIIECEHIYLHQTSIDLKIEIPKEKIEQFDNIIINGIKYSKDKSE